MLYEEFATEMRLQFNRHNDAAESLGKKAKELMTISGVILILLMGFNQFIFDVNDESTPLLPYVLFFISIILMLITVGFCVWANSVEFQKNPILGKNLQKNGKLDLDIFNSWVKAKKEDFFEALTEAYVECLVQAENVIESKAKKVSIANYIFLVGLVLIPIIVVLIHYDLISDIVDGLLTYLKIQQ